MAQKRTVMFGTAFREGGVWVARSLFPVEHAAQADTKEEAIRLCVQGVKADLKFAIEHDSLEYLRPAPTDELLRFLAASGRRSAPGHEEVLDVSLPGGPRRRIAGSSRFELQTVGTP